MEILLVIACVLLVVTSIYEAITAIRNLVYQKKWDDEKEQFICDDPAITAAELCAKYIDFCARNHCFVEY